MKNALIWAMVLVTSLASAAFGAQTNCPQHFVDGQAPELITSLRQKAREVCYNEFAVLHSGVTRTPLYVAEHLNPLRLTEAMDMVRDDSFHPELAIPAAERAELKDYKASGYDRGHMAPNADFSNQKSQYESFSLANMVPQNPNNNRGIWKRIEEATRDYVMKSKHTLFAYSGPVYDKNPQMLNGRVAIPSKLYKAIYDATTKQTGVYLVDNKPGIGYRIISVTELKAMTGIDVFPSLPIAAKGTSMVLPKP